MSCTVRKTRLYVSGIRGGCYYALNTSLKKAKAFLFIWNTLTLSTVYCHHPPNLCSRFLFLCDKMVSSTRPESDSLSARVKSFKRHAYINVTEGSFLEAKGCGFVWSSRKHRGISAPTEAPCNSRSCLPRLIHSLLRGRCVAFAKT